MADSDGIFAELRRRKVFRVIAAYAVGGWALIEFADVAFPRLALPDWTATFVLVLVLLGFPVAATLAWALEVTPEGIRRTGERSAPRDISDPPTESTLATWLILRLRTWRWAGSFVAAGVLLVSTGVVAAQWLEAGRTGGSGTLIGQGLAQKYDEIVVADLASPFDPGLGKIAAEWLRAEIDQSDIIRPVSPTAIGSAVRRMERDPSLPLDEPTAREIAIRDGYPLVVVGEIVDLADDYLLTVRLESADGDVLGRFNDAGAANADLVDALDRIGGEIRARIGESQRSIRRSAPLEQVTTESVEALRFYTEAVRTARWEGRQRDAIPLLERAIEFDTAFASAMWILHVAMNNLRIWSPRRVELLERAYRHRDRTTDFERLSVEAAYVAEHRDPGNECDAFELMFRLYDAYVHRHPADPRPLNMYGWVLDRLGRKAEAVDAWERAIALGYYSSIIYSNLVEAHLFLGNEEAALATLARWRQRFDDSPLVGYKLRMHAYHNGDYDRLDALLDSSLVVSPQEPRLLEAQAQVDVLRGRFREGIRHYKTAVQAHDKEGGSGAHQRLMLSLVRMLAMGDTLRALRDVTALLDTLPRPSDGLWLNSGVLYALAGDLPRAREGMDTLVARGLQSTGLFLLLPAAIEIAAGEPDEAIAILDAADLRCTFSGSCLGCFPLFRGRAHEVAGRPDSAIRAYRKFTASPQGLTWDAIFRFDTLERLGRLHEGLGDRDQAAGYYARAAALWNDADPEFQPRARWLQERAAALVGER